jgi:hypothetical protein
VVAAYLEAAAPDVTFEVVGAGPDLDNPDFSLARRTEIDIMPQ